MGSLLVAPLQLGFTAWSNKVGRVVTWFLDTWWAILGSPMLTSVLGPQGHRMMKNRQVEITPTWELVSCVWSSFQTVDHWLSQCVHNRLITISKWLCHHPPRIKPSPVEKQPCSSVFIRVHPGSESAAMLCIWAIGSLWPSLAKVQRSWTKNVELSERLRGWSNLQTCSPTSANLNVTRLHAADIESRLCACAFTS